jgi:hypothetical protein
MRSCSTHGGDEKCIKFGSENLKGRNHSEDMSTDGRIILKCVLKKKPQRVWTGFIWLRIGSSDGLL